MKFTLASIVYCLTLPPDADTLNHRYYNIATNPNNDLMPPQQQQLVKQAIERLYESQQQQPEQQFSKHEGNEKENYLELKRQQERPEQKVIFVGPQRNDNAGQQQFPEVLRLQKQLKQRRQGEVDPFDLAHLAGMQELMRRQPTMVENGKPWTLQLIDDEYNNNNSNRNSNDDDDDNEDVSKLFVQQLPRNWYNANDNGDNDNGDIIGSPVNIDNYNEKANKKRNNNNKDSRINNNNNNEIYNSYNNNENDISNSNNIYGYPISIGDSVTFNNGQNRHHNINNNNNDNNNKHQDGESISSYGGGGADDDDDDAASVQRHQDASNDFRSQFSIFNEPIGISAWRGLKVRGNTDHVADIIQNVINNKNNKNSNGIAIDNAATEQEMTDCNGICNKSTSTPLVPPNSQEEPAFDEIIIHSLENDQEDAEAVDSDYDTLYGIQNVHKRSPHVVHHGRIYQSLCPNKSQLMQLETSAYEYRPTSYVEITCAHSFSPVHRNDSMICTEAGFSCIQLKRDIHLIRRKKGSTECWESEVRRVPSGCECMWPKHDYGDIVKFHEDPQKRNQQTLERPEGPVESQQALLAWLQHMRLPNLISITNGRPQLGEAPGHIGFNALPFN